MSDWSLSSSNDIAEKLNELNQWQIEQQKKLKSYQESQRQLLDFEHQKILERLRTCNYDERFSNDDCSIGDSASRDNDLLYREPPKQLFQIKTQPIKLKEPKKTQINIRSASPVYEENESSTPVDFEENRNARRPFLKRGDGLARFRMTLDDFKSPPNIYREKKIKTYLKEKPEFNNKRYPVKKPTSSNAVRRKPVVPVKNPNKCLSVPVNIYIADNKNKKVNNRPEPPKKNLNCVNRKSREFPVPKAPINDLVLKSSVATEWYNVMKKSELEEKIFKNEEKQVEVVRSPENEREMEKQMKKDEKELKIFEILEGKVNDSSFCSNSSFITKLMEESISSTPAKPSSEIQVENKLKSTYMEGLKNLQKQFLNDEQIKRIENFSDEDSEDESVKKIKDCKIQDQNGEVIGVIEPTKVDNQDKKPRPSNDQEILKEDDNGKIEERCEKFCEKIQEEPRRKPEPLKFMKGRVLQEYIENFKKMKSDITETVNRAESEVANSVATETANSTVTEASPQKDDLRQLNHHEAALKIQRKALQDNVKHLLNWEGTAKKKPKKLVKKPKIKQPKLDKPKKEQKKFEFDGALLKRRLEELEKEIELFRKENRTLTKLQKDLEDDRMRFEREKKELEKHMQEEKEKFEAKIAEEQKKLQRDKNVFEKYCKQVKNQPSRQEREEIANLKKELEKLTETLSTKESRWGAYQARLRNQLKALEKENSQLKAEVEKYKKQMIKKVTFDNGKNIQTKIIHAINSELGKLRPNVIKNKEVVTAKQKYQSLSARVDTNLKQKPIRRIKSAPDFKKVADGHSGNDLCNGDDLPETEIIRSLSTDSGVETNDSRFISSRRENDVDGMRISLGDTDLKTGNKLCEFSGRDGKSPSDLGTLEEVSDRVMGSFSERSAKVKENGIDDGRKLEDDKFSGMKGYGKEYGDVAVYEALFNSDHYKSSNPKILEIKKRLGKLNLLNKTDPILDTQTSPNVERTSFNGRRNSESFETNSNSDESYETDNEPVEVEDRIEEPKILHSKKDSENIMKLDYGKNYIVETKINENGVREKIYEDGRKEICYPNGNIKKISPNGTIIKMVYYNGDIKETNIPEGSEKYYYAETKTWHTTYKDGLEVLEFPNGQTERRRPDGSTEISFPNGCVRYCDPSGKDEWRFVDGTVVKTNKEGHKVLLMPNGQKEIHTKEYKRREYPDGTVKLLYADGTQETRYASGRVRLKDKDGNLIMDCGGIR